MKPGLTSLVFLFLSVVLVAKQAAAFESSLPDSAACTEWKSQMTSWFQSKKVKLTGDEKEVMLACSETGASATGRIAFRLSSQRAQEIAAFKADLNCGTPGTPGKPAVQRSVASVSAVSDSLLNTSCKIAANDIKLFQEAILKAPVTAVSEGYVCCAGDPARRWVSCTSARMFDKGCVLCAACPGIQTGPSWR